jgi:uncharacterized damage-inducible protein DinB
MMILRISISSLLPLILGSVLIAAIEPIAGSVAKAATAQTQDDRAADAAAIRAHIESIFQAFIEGDVEKIHATHSDDWRGFLEGSRVPIKGIDEYMRANGIEWPRPANAPKNTPYFPAGTRYRVSNFDVHFYGPELAVASFFGDFERNIGEATVTLRRFRIMDVYAKRKGSWIQVASHTVIDPDWRQEQMSKLATVTPQIREQVLATREAVWKAYFANDRATLQRLLPEEVIAIDNGSNEWSDQAAIFAGAKSFADNGGKLVRLEFPKTEMQIYGSAVIVYTTYVCETEMNGKRRTASGRGTEIFIRRGNGYIHTLWHLDSKPVGAQQPGSDDAAAALRKNFTEVSGWVSKAAGLAPADKYSYRPTQSTRTFGQLIAHIADSYNYYCARAAGRDTQWSDAIEKGATDKATLAQKLKQATDSCNAAYGGANNAGPLIENIGHTNLHYGNIVTYMRMLGLTPPSS